MEQLNQSEFIYYLNEIKSELGKRNIDRVEKLLSFLEKEDISKKEFSLKAILDILYPDKTPKEALDAFIGFLHAINLASKDLNINFSVEVDSRLRSDIS